jgi:hypothetical protein
VLKARLPVPARLIGARSAASSHAVSSTAGRRPAGHQACNATDGHQSHTGTGRSGQADARGRAGQTFRTVGTVRCVPVGEPLRGIPSGPDPDKPVLLQALHDAAKPKQHLFTKTLAQAFAKFAQSDNYLWCFAKHGEYPAAVVAVRALVPAGGLSAARHAG